MSSLKEKFTYLTDQPAFREEPWTVLFRLASWRCHCVLGIPGTFTMPPSARMWVPARWKDVSKLFFAFREKWERELAWLPQALSAGGIFIDVGACYGIYSVIASRLVGESGRVLAFEPAAESFSILRRNLGLNGFTNVTARRLALSSEAGIVRLFHFSDPCLNSLRESEDSRSFESVTASTLDREADLAGLSHANVVKIDAEGAEELVLRGSQKLISSSHPTFVFELNAAAAGGLGLSPGGAWDLLLAWGYRFWAVGERGRLRALDSPPDYGNVIATFGPNESQFLQPERESNVDAK